MNSKVSLLTHVDQNDKERAARSLSFRLIARLLSFTKPYAMRRNVLLCIVVIRSLQLPALAWMIGVILGGPIARHDRHGIIMGAAGYALLALSTQLVLRYRSRLALELGEDVIRDMRKSMFAHLQTMSMSFFHHTRLGRVISRFTSDSEAMRAGIQNVLFVSLVNIGQMVGAGVLMLIYDAWLFLIVAGLGPVVWLINRYFHKRLSTAYRAMQESFSRVTATLAETVNGIRVTQGFVREQTNADMFHDLVRDHSLYSVGAARTAGIFLPLLEFKTQLFVALVLLIGGWRVLNHHAEVEDLYQFLLMATVFFAPIRVLASQYNSAMAAMAGAERVFSVLDQKPDWVDPDDASPIEDLRGSVCFENVSFAYDEGRPVLHNIDFACEPGQTIALVGHTGSGKSSIINLIAKFYLPTEGRVLIDGRNLIGIESDSLHRQMGIVLQSNFLFTGTVMANIQLGKPDSSREDVIQAAKQLDCLDLIAAMPDGFNTSVGEGGSGISLGQRQLICFTRAMLANPHILILDEATSAVDTMTEARVQKALGTLLKARTSFVVAHRLSTIRHASQVLVLQNGRITERGTHDELLLQGEHYAELYRQFVRSSAEGENGG